MVQFSLRIGSDVIRPGCRAPVSRDESVIVDYSIDGGVTWQTMRVLDAFMFSASPQRVTIELPDRARTPATAFRWWQPVLTAGNVFTSLSALNAALTQHVEVKLRHLVHRSDPDEPGAQQLLIVCHRSVAGGVGARQCGDRAEHVTVTWLPRDVRPHAQRRLVHGHERRAADHVRL